MQKVLNTITSLLVVVAVVLICFVSETEGAAAWLWGCLCTLLAVLCGLLEYRMSRKLNQQKPVITVDATVLSHRIVRERVGYKHTDIYHHVVFRTADGKRLEFQVSELDYEDFDLGETGPLRYRGWEFLSFGVRDKSDVKPIAPLPEEYDLHQEKKGSAARWWRTLADKRRTRGSKRKNDAKAEPLPEASANETGVLTHELDE